MKQKIMLSLRQIKCELLEIIPRNLHYHNNKIKQISYCHNDKAIAVLGHKDLICPLGPESGCCWNRRWVSVCSYD
jgi:hypothetical protein